MEKPRAKSDRLRSLIHLKIFSRYTSQTCTQINTHNEISMPSSSSRLKRGVWTFRTHIGQAIAEANRLMPDQTVPIGPWFQPWKHWNHTWFSVLTGGIATIDRWAPRPTPTGSKQEGPLIEQRPWDRSCLYHRQIRS